MVYSGDDPVEAPPEAIIARAESTFRIRLDVRKIKFVYIRRRWLLEASMWPVATMLMQSLASMVVAVEALFLATPDVFVDTTGFAFTFFPAVRSDANPKVRPVVR